MRLFKRNLFLTLVVVSLFAGPLLAAPSKEYVEKPEDYVDTESTDPNVKPSATKTEPTQLSYPHNSVNRRNLKPQPIHRLKSVVRGDKFLGIQVAMISGDLQETSQNLSLFAYGFTYIYKDQPERSWDFGLAGSDKNVVVMGIGRRFYFENDYFFKSYYKYSVFNFIRSGDLTSALINFRNFKAAAVIGAADLFEHDEMFSGELGIGYGQAGLMTLIGLSIHF